MLKINKETDYIVSQGGSTEAWIWRKWSSGIAECWRSYTETTATAFSATGNVYYRTANFSFPANFFIEPPTVNATVGCGNITASSVADVTTTTFKVGIMSAVATARAVDFQIHAIGRWK